MPESRFIAVGHNGVRLGSADGAEWKHQQTGKEGETYRAVCIGNGAAVAVGSYGGGNIFAVTRDGAAWKTYFKDAKYVRYVRGLAFGKDAFLGLGGDPGSVGSSRPFATHSTDGMTWTEPVEFSGKHILRRAAFGNGVFVGVGDRGRRSVSPDGKEWRDAPDVKAVDTLVDVAFGNGVFVGVGLHGLRMCSEDGLKWTDRLVGEEGEHLNSVVRTADTFVAVGMGATYVSGDGRKWKRTANKDAPLTVAYGNGVFVGASWRGRLVRSADGVEWKPVFKSDNHIEALAFGELAGN